MRNAFFHIGTILFVHELSVLAEILQLALWAIETLSYVITAFSSKQYFNDVAGLMNLYSADYIQLK